MAVEKKIAIASFGNRDAQISSLVDNIRQYSDLPILLLTDRQRQVMVEQQVIPKEELLWRDSPRWPVRNCNLWLAKAAMDTRFNWCCLNDDMKIVHPSWIEGFDLAEKFNICVPTNPRIFVKYNMLGADTTIADWQRAEDTTIHGPACNMSPMFVFPNKLFAQVLLGAYIAELHKCMRGTLAFWLASWKTGITPLYLPEQWCVGASNAKYIRDYKKVLQGKPCRIEPIMLHWGQNQVREVFKDWEPCMK
jgi:hypothetical protein